MTLTAWHERYYRLDASQESVYFPLDITINGDGTESLKVIPPSLIVSSRATSGHKAVERNS